MYIEFLRLRVYPAAVLGTSMFSSLFSPVYADDHAHEQTFVVTAYYSPLPDQCCYFRGNYEAEIEFNGKGIKGADGTGVYPGMIAGPNTYPFGTVIELPGIGIGTIHDRGGRIIEWGDDIHRIDLWMGYGEPGLARALAWGARKVKGKVYPIGTEAPKEHFVLENFNADSEVLASLPKTDPLLIMEGVAFEQGGQYGVRMVQSALHELGYLTQVPNGNFGPATREALRKFQGEYGIIGDGTSVDRRTAATLVAASSIRETNLPIMEIGLSEGTSGQSVRQSQKLLRYLGYYRGRTDGNFDDDMKQAVTVFQINMGIISDVKESGAGRIGPATQAAILRAWKVKVAGLKATALATRVDITQRVKKKEIPTKYLSLGHKGQDVRLLQSFLSQKGYLLSKDVTGTFGSKTEAALTRYQSDKKIISSAHEKGAGVFGPSTKNAVSEELVSFAWNNARALGMESL